MKKILLVALTLLVTGTMYADKKCCKDKASCKKETAAKGCSHDEASGKACAGKDGHASADSAAPEEMHACCKKSVASGGKACCAKGGHSDVQTPKGNTPQPVRDDTK